MLTASSAIQKDKLLMYIKHMGLDVKCIVLNYVFDRPDVLSSMDFYNIPLELEKLVVDLMDLSLRGYSIVGVYGSNMDLAQMDDMTTNIDGDVIESLLAKLKSASTKGDGHAF